MAMYCTIDELRADGITAEQASDQVLTDLIDLAETYIEKMTLRYFEPRDRTLKLDGTGHDTLWLPIPIISIASVKVDGSLIDPSWYVIYNRREPDDRGNPKIVANLIDWPKGRQNIELAGSFGYTDEKRSDGTPITPRPINRVARKLVIRELPSLGDPEAQEEKKRSRIISETTDGHSYTLASVAVSGDWTGDPEIDDVLYSYRRPPGVGSV